jgi:PAS domain S-box-containing protein
VPGRGFSLAKEHIGRGHCPVLDVIMNIFILSSLLACVTTAFLGTFVLLRNPKELSNQIFFLYCLAGSLASFTEFAYRQAESFATALFWLRASFPWIFSLPLELHFVMLLTESTKLLKRKSTYLLLYVPTLIFSILWVTGLIQIDPMRVYWGWTYERSPNNISLILLGIFVGIVSLYELVLCVHYYTRKAKGKKRQQVRLILTGFIITLVLVFISEPGWVLPGSAGKIPRLASVGFVIESILLSYAIWKYELFSLTPVTAAESILSTLADALLLVDLEGKIGTVNYTTLELLGYEEEELVGQPIEIVLGREQAIDFQQVWFEQLLTVGSIRDVETIFITKDAKQIPISLSASVVRDKEDVQQGISYVGRDLTERKQAEERIKASLREKEILLKEIHHRVKNNLQVISSLLYLQAKGIQDERVLATLKESRNRVYSMATIHEILYSSQDLAGVDFGEYTRKLAKHLLHSYDANSHHVSLKTEIAPISLNMDAAISCGLIVNELLSNSLKYAFPAGQPGEICIVLDRIGDDRLLLAISDNGVGFPSDLDFHQAESLGLRLVNLLAQQLEGTLTLNRSHGTAFELVFSAEFAIEDF